MVAPERATKLMQQARSAVDEARTLSKAVSKLARALRQEYPELARVSVRLHDAEEGMVRVAGIWTASPSAIGRGFALTSTATSMPDLIRTGKPLIQEDARAEYPLDEVLRSEGIRSWVSILLRRDGSGVGMLSFSSAQPHTFLRADEEFFAALGQAMEDRLLELANTPETG